MVGRGARNFYDRSIHPKGGRSGVNLSHFTVTVRNHPPFMLLTPPSLVYLAWNSIALFINVYDSFGYASAERWRQRSGTDWKPSFRKGGCRGVLWKGIEVYVGRVWLPNYSGKVTWNDDAWFRKILLGMRSHSPRQLKRSPPWRKRRLEWGKVYHIWRWSTLENEFFCFQNSCCI